MLKIEAKYIQLVEQSNRLEDLYPMLQNAIELEHSTIPPYLTALFSIRQGVSTEARKIVHSIVIEEMMHMTIAANILNAIGGQPQINNPQFVPAYPGPLPMGIGQGLIVGLEKYSLNVVEHVFMEIEEPENPLVLKSVVEELPTYATIGQFYLAIQQKIEEIAPDILPGNKEYQVTSSFFDSDQLFPIYTKQDAIRAIDIIVEQGEGTSISPVDQDGEIAHYYRFEELVRQRKLIKDDNAPYGYSFSGDPIVYNPADVKPLFPNTKLNMLQPGTEEWYNLAHFNSSYFSLLAGLHTTFNGAPDELNNTIGIMFDLKLIAEKLGATPFPGKPGYTIGPSFEFNGRLPV